VLWCGLTGLAVWRARAPRCSGQWRAAIATQAGVATVATAALMARAVHCAHLRAAAAAPQLPTAKVTPASARGSDDGGGGRSAPPNHHACAAAREAPGIPGPCGREPGVRTPGRLAVAGVASVLAGFIGGMLGVGGGMVVAPLLLAMRLPPPVAAATSTLLVLFSSSSAAAAAAATSGALNGIYVAAFAPATAVAGAVGVVGAARYVKRSGRESAFVFLLAAVVAVGAVLTVAVSGSRAVADVREGRGGLVGVC
jgi:hypothetical protein